VLLTRIINLLMIFMFGFLPFIGIHVGAHMVTRAMSIPPVAACCGTHGEHNQRQKSEKFGCQASDIRSLTH
jgi:hypothetical protein